MVYNFDVFINSTGFTICVLLFMIIISIIYYRKRKSGIQTSALFFSLILFAFFPLILDVLAYASMCFIPESFKYRELIINIFSRSTLIFSMFWIVIFMYYVVVLILKNVFGKMQGDDKKYLSQRVITYTVALIVCVILGCVLPYKIMFTGENGSLLIYGLMYYFVNLEFMISIALLFGMLIIYGKKIPNSYISPFVVIMILYTLLTFLSFTNGYYSNNLSSFFGFLTTILFFTIESQDIQILTNYKKNKEFEEISNNNRQKLLVNMSHQVRSPLYNMIGYTEFLKENDLSIKEKSDYLENVSSSTLVLKNMLNNIIDASKIQENNSSVKMNEYNTKDLFLDINNNVIKNNNKDNTIFTFNYDKELPNVLYSDYEKVFKIVTNVISNAYKCVNYGEVKLDISGKKLNNQYIELTYKISNSGHVMTQEMFDLNIQDYISTTTNIDYIEVGLIVAKQYIEMLGGNIEFINQEGMGTQYIIKLKEKIINDSSVGSLI